MKILIDIGHPAAVHLFKNLIKELSLNDHEILVTAREKDVTITLLKRYNINYISFGPPKKGLLRKILGTIFFTYKLFKVIKRFKPTIILNSTTIYPIILKPFIKTPIISFHNTDSDPALNLLKYMNNIYITPNNFKTRLGKNHIKINSYHELAFLHPNQLNTELYDKQKENIFGLNTKIILIRFVSWEASDDRGLKGFSLEEKLRLVEKMKKYGRIIISSEVDLPNELEEYRLESNKFLNKLEMQFIEYCSSIFIGESGAMAAESALLGVPAIFYSNKYLGFINELNEKYQLILKISNMDDLFRVSESLLNDEHSSGIWDGRLKKLVSENIDLTAFMIWLLKEYPSSYLMLRKNIKILNRFN